MARQIGFAKRITKILFSTRNENSFTAKKLRKPYRQELSNTKGNKSFIDSAFTTFPVSPMK
ncbi:hypothetical protein SAMN04488553_2486 [Gramella sp. MAR_2010_147]|nr:hypothetical protein SAMN04488553_2486 [Gramella sp. MAR_2010_147]